MARYRTNGHKFNATATVVDGIRFASQAEARRYGELKLLEKAGEIQGLVLQPKYPLLVNGHQVGAYVADFEYSRVEQQGKVLHRVVEDVKGLPTPMYRWKKKHFEIQYNWQVTEIGRATKATKAKRAVATRRSAAQK